MTQRERDIKKAIKRLTKRIGEARRDHDFNEVANLRSQRGTFAQALMEEFEQGYAIIDGKTKFMPLEELEEHYNDNDVKKAVGISSATNELFQARGSILDRVEHVNRQNAEDVKTQILAELAQELAQLEKIIGDINPDKKYDFEEIDKRRAKNKSFLDGFDMTSLE